MLQQVSAEMDKRPIQVNAAWYRRNYMTLPHMVTHWHQANEIPEATTTGQIGDRGPCGYGIEDRVA
jgi:hypothetical protein